METSIFYNKETRTEDGVYYRAGDWGVEKPSDFADGNFTKNSPPAKSLNHNVPCDWDDDSETWNIDKMAEWVFDMEQSDSIMSRGEERVWDSVGIDNADQYVKDLYDQKKELRNKKPI